MIFNAPISNAKDIKFYPPPATTDWIIDRNSDSATDGSGNTGSLRYCMTNAAWNATFKWADTIQDTAATGDITTTIITSQLPNKNGYFYGNNHFLTIPPNSSFSLFSGTASNNYYFYSLHFRDFNRHTARFGVNGLFYGYFYGCRFKRISQTSSFYFYYSYCEDCEFTDINSAYLNVPSALRSKFRNVNAINQGTGAFTECYFENCTSISSNGAQPLTTIIDKCLIINSTVFVGGLTNTLKNSIVVTRDGLIMNSNSTANNVFNCYNNTIVVTNQLSYLISNTGSSSTINFKNNLVIAPSSTYVMNQALTSTVVESGNIYMALNADAKLPTSTRHTGNIAAIVDLVEKKKTINGVQHYYFNPKGTSLLACARITGVETDYNGVSRPNPCDCGAVQT